MATMPLSLGFEPIARLDAIELPLANQLLEQWGHRMGPINRPAGLVACHALSLNGNISAVAVSADLIAPRVAGFARHEALELARLCAVRPDMCRVALRLWREAVFPAFGRRWAISYQDNNLHSGNAYRFDGWVKLGRSRSGVDRNSGRPGRDKTIWGWCDSAIERRSRSALAVTSKEGV